MCMHVLGDQWAFAYVIMHARTHQHKRIWYILVASQRKFPLLTARTSEGEEAMQGVSIQKLTEKQNV